MTTPLDLAAARRVAAGILEHPSEYWAAASGMLAAACDEIEALRARVTPGPTGRHPDGKLSPNDEGETAMRLSALVKRRLVLLEFGTPTKWLAMKPDEARALAVGLCKFASGAEGR